MNRPTFEDFKKKALKKSGVKEAFDKLELEYELKLKLIKMRKKANMTQEEVAIKMNTNRSNIARLESFDYKSSPTVSTLVAYAKATGHKLKLNFSN
ncbi:MAG: helix-turn-helix domain-containing protein [Sulfurospirillaceae bacterium]|jgi:DNA-binding XRE family transcriptional regulator|nr:helix-turn-helix domain-containing protein [Sulfurospirillaceae bacterium]MCK9546119.1 helix-turn-helix domain-containing protein [Sulfurospirillaceae bacterium]